MTAMPHFSQFGGWQPQHKTSILLAPSSTLIVAPLWYFVHCLLKWNCVTFMRVQEVLLKSAFLEVYVLHISIHTAEASHLYNPANWLKVFCESHKWKDLASTMTSVQPTSYSGHNLQNPVCNHSMQTYGHKSFIHIQPWNCNPKCRTLWSCSR